MGLVVPCLMGNGQAGHVLMGCQGTWSSTSAFGWGDLGTPVLWHYPRAGCCSHPPLAARNLSSTQQHWDTQLSPSWRHPAWLLTCLIIDMLLRVIISSEAPACARDSETCVSPCCCTPELTDFLLHLQLPVLQHTAAWEHSIPPSTQKCEMTTLLVRSLLQDWEQVLLCEIKEAPKGILICSCQWILPAQHRVSQEAVLCSVLLLLPSASSVAAAVIYFFLPSWE